MHNHPNYLPISALLAHVYPIYPRVSCPYSHNLPLGMSSAARTDWLWMPNITQGGPQMASGRPWPYTGDNPAPYIDPITGHVTALYRTDSHSGGHVSYREASLIGAYAAPSWRGPYRLVWATMFFVQGRRKSKPMTSSILHPGGDG